MRIRKILFIIPLLTIPQACFGLMYSVSGNKPQAAGNYKEWPKLVEVVNDTSRVSLVWCNGDEHLSYQGETKSLNRVLQNFAAVESDELRVVLRPPLKDAKGKPADWQLHVTTGIATVVIERNGETPVEDECPTLTIYLSDKIKLQDLVIPGELIVDQVEDLRARYLLAQNQGNAYAKASAARALRHLDADANRQGEAAKRYEEQIRQIRDWVEKRRAVLPK